MMIHIAGPDIVLYGRHLRQRCAWCGATLVDADLTKVAAPAGQDPHPGTWPVGALVAVDGGMSYTLGAAAADSVLPEGACGLLDPAATR